MALEGTGTPPKTKKSGIFPDSIRKVVIICSIIVFLIIAIIGAIGIWNNWGIVFNLIFLVLAVVSVVFGLLALWPSKESAEAPVYPGPGSSPKFENNIHIHFPDNHQSPPPEDRISAPVSVPVDTGNHDQSPQPAQYAATGSTPVHHAPIGSSGMTTNEFKNASRGAKLQLSGQGRKALRNALLNAYPDQGDFEIVIQDTFNEPLNAYVDVHQNYEKILFDLIGKMESRGWTEKLIEAACDSNPDNEILKNFYLTYVQNREAQTNATARADTPASPLTNRPASQPSSQDNNFNNSGYTGGVPLANPPSSPAPDPPAQTDPPATRPLSPIEQARVDVNEAQSLVEKADKLLPKGISAAPENIRDARSHLTDARKSIHDLEALLNSQTGSPLPEPLASNKARITGWISSAVYEQMENLLESLNKGMYGDSKLLRVALTEIQKLISE